jgi:hypothetical protein
MVILPEVLTFFGLSREFRNAGYFETEQAHRIPWPSSLPSRRVISSPSPGSPAVARPPPHDASVRT